MTRIIIHNCATALVLFAVGNGMLKERDEVPKSVAGVK